MRIYAIRNWIEQGYKQVKDELGWADFQVRSDLAIRRYRALVYCAFSFRWAAWFGGPPPRHADCGTAAGTRPRREGGPRRGPAASPVPASGASRGPRLAFPVDRAAALVDRMVQGAPAAAAASPDQLGRGRLRPHLSTSIQRTTVSALPEALCQLLGSAVGSLYPVYPHDGDQVLFDLIQHPVRTDAQPAVGAADERARRRRIVS